MQRIGTFPHKNYKSEFFTAKRLIVTLWLQDVIFYANAMRLSLVCAGTAGNIPLFGLQAYGCST
jgi:hypothetical protein